MDCLLLCPLASVLLLLYVHKWPCILILEQYVTFLLSQFHNGTKEKKCTACSANDVMHKPL